MLAAIAIVAGVLAVPAAAEINLKMVYIAYSPLSLYDNNQVSGFNVE